MGIKTPTQMMGSPRHWYNYHVPFWGKFEDFEANARLNGRYYRYILRVEFGGRREDLKAPRGNYKS